MKKIPCLFKREFRGKQDFTLLREVTPGCEWVLAGEGVATRKWDGTACLVKDGKLYARYDAKRGKTPPEGAIPCCDPDPETGHWPHWVEAKDQPQFKWHREAWESYRLFGGAWDGTYECCGPKLQTNAEHLDGHVLIRHGTDPYPECPRDFDGLREWLSWRDIEGIVFHHPDGRMAKIRKADFGLPRKPVLP